MELENLFKGFMSLQLKITQKINVSNTFCFFCCWNCCIFKLQVGRSSSIQGISEQVHSHLCLESCTSTHPAQEAAF